MALSSGAGAERRKLLDRVALYIAPASLADLDLYAKALRARQRVLETRGESAADLDGWEELVVRHGMAIASARREAASRISPAVVSAFRRIGPPGLDVELTFVGGAPAEATAFRDELRRRRAQDRARKAATVGPHRDDLRVVLGGYPMRGIASQGQHRAVVLAMELAEIDVVTGVRGVRPVLLLDDVSSELDRERTAALLGALGDHEGQVVLTTTRPEIFEVTSPARGSSVGPKAPETARFEVRRGEIFGR
jgi:DNA replication and repair protein RecF